MATITLREMLEAGVHFGHQTSRWNPKMKRFILTERNGNYVLDLRHSLVLIDQAYAFVKQTVRHGGNILFVGTKRQAQRPIIEQATRVGMPFVDHRWLGGMLTNFATVSTRVDRLKELATIDYEDVAGSGRTKKELLLLAREFKKLQANLGGIRNMTRTPSAVWIVDTQREHLAVKEANKLGIPVIAILDTNANPDEVDYPIPGNDDAVASVELLTRVIADAVADGLMSQRKVLEEQDSSDELVTWAHHGSYHEALNAVQAVLAKYPTATIVEIEREDDGTEFEIELVKNGTLYELEVTDNGEVTLDDTETEAKEIRWAQEVTRAATSALEEARTLHPTAIFDSIELEEEDGRLYWEVELKDQQGHDIEFNLPATNAS